MTTTVVKMKDGVTKFAGKDTPTLRFALKDVWFYFLTTAPRPNKGKKFDPKFPAKDSSYSVQVLVSDEDVLDEIEKSKTKDGYTKVTRAVVKAEDFEEQFKCKPPFEAKKYYFLKLTRHAAFSDGATFAGSHFVPMVVYEDGQPVKYDAKAIEYVKAQPDAKHEAKKDYNAIKLGIQIGNGSKGHVVLAGSWYAFEGETNQKPIQEQFVITDLIPYVSTGKSTELTDDDMDALGLSGVEFVEAATPIEREIDNANEQDDDEPLPDADEEFATE